MRLSSGGTRPTTASSAARPAVARRSSLLAAAVAALVAVLAAGCGSSSPGASAPDTGRSGATAASDAATPGPADGRSPGRGPGAVPPARPPGSSAGGGVDSVSRPPDVRLTYAGGSTELAPYTWCFRNGCVDGVPGRSPRIGDPAEVFLDFPFDWRFTAQLVPVGRRCAPALPAPVERLGPGSYVIRPAGPPGDYRVSLFGRGRGDVAAEFRWTTPVAGPLPDPTARLALVARHDGALDSYGVELAVRHLASTPHRASARITATAANGRTLTFAATRARGCTGDGTVSFDGPDSAGRAAAALGPAPFTYRVLLRLDGHEHVAVARWPRDVVRGTAPSVRLSFTPALPSAG